MVNRSRGVRAGRVEGPRVAEELEPTDGGAVADGDLLDGVLWSGDGDEPLGWESVRELQVTASRLRGVRLTGVELEDLTLVDTAIDGCELSGAVLSGARGERVAFTDCRMAGLVAADLKARHVRFSNCLLTGAWLRAASFDHCELVDCDLTGADLSGARLVATRLVRCRLDHADLSAAHADDLALHGSTLDGTKGLAELRKVIIASDQLVDVALPLLAAHQIRIDDDYLSPDESEASP